jgi:hypothetical protein
MYIFFDSHFIFKFIPSTYVRLMLEKNIVYLGIHRLGYTDSLLTSTYVPGLPDFSCQNG